MRVSLQTSAIMSAWCIMVNSFSNGFMFSLWKAFNTNICKVHLFVSLAVCNSLYQETESLTCALTYLHMFEFLFSQTKWESLYVCFCMCCLYAPVHACVSHAWYVQTAASNGLKITWNFFLNFVSTAKTLHGRPTGLPRHAMVGKRIVFHWFG